MVELLELIKPTLVTLVGLVLGYLGMKLKTYINLKISMDKQLQIMNIIEASVEFVEQVSGEQLLSQDKLALAKHRALVTLNDLGLSITDEELTMWIESFVYQLQ